MSFHKVFGDELVSAPSVEGPGFELREESHADHTYPVDGWHYFPERLEALLTLMPFKALQILKDVTPEGGSQ